MPWPDIAVLGENFNGSLRAKAGTGSPVDADALPTYSIYEDGTNTSILSGSYAKLDDDNTTGFYQVEIACTAANGFERFKTYHVDSLATINATNVATSDSFIVFGSSDVFTSSSGALTTTSNFKEYAGITGSDNDSLIAALINRATSAIQKFCDKTFIATTFREIRDGRSDEIQLDEYPVISIQMFSGYRQQAIQLSNTSTDAYNAYVQIDDDTMTLVVQGGANAGSNELTLTDSATLTALETAILALDVGWAVDVSSELALWDPIELLPVSGLNCLTDSASLDIPSTPFSGYLIDNDAGIVTNCQGYYGWYDEGGYGDGYSYGRYNRGYSYGPLLRGRARLVQQIVIRYTAGFVTTPGDLEQICIDLTKVYYDARTQSGSLESEKIGDYSYKIGADGSMVMPKGIQQRLSGWRRRSF